MIPDKKGLEKEIPTTHSFDQYVIPHDNRKTVLTSQEFGLKDPAGVFDFEDNFDSDLDKKPLASSSEDEQKGLMTFMLSIDQIERKLKKMTSVSTPP